VKEIWRKQNYKMAKRTKFLMVRLTPDEYAKLKKLAEELSLFVASYVRDTIFKREIIKNERTR